MTYTFSIFGMIIHGVAQLFVVAVAIYVMLSIINSNGHHGSMNILFASIIIVVVIFNMLIEPYKAEIIDNKSILLYSILRRVEIPITDILSISTAWGLEMRYVGGRVIFGGSALSYQFSKFIKEVYKINPNIKIGLFVKIFYNN